MTEQEFKEFFEKRTYLSKEKIADIISESSDAQFLKRLSSKYANITEEQANAMASIVRKNVTTSIAMYESGASTKKEVLNYKIEELPKDFP